MQKNISALEIVKNDNAYTLMFKDGATAGELFDVLCEMRAYVLAHIVSCLDKEKQAIAAPAAVEVVEEPEEEEEGE